MTPRELMARAAIPGGGELSLYRRGDDFIIALGRDDLMSSRMSGSEEALAIMTCERLTNRVAPQLLIGGYGMGFTLRAAGDCLDDARLTLVERDVVELIEEGQGGYDAILLDVDNGPDGLTRSRNDRLYSTQGLEAARVALRKGGVLAVWSAAPDMTFKRRLRESGFAVEEVAVRARSNGKGPRHVIWFGKN